MTGHPDDAATPTPEGAGSEHPVDAAERTEELRTCPGCRGTTGSGPFCENCGDEVDAAVPQHDSGMLVLGGPAAAPPPPRGPTPSLDDPHCDCGGTFADDYCEQCGSPQPDPRDHTESHPASWAAGVSDVGVRHRSNQDAMALHADARRGAFVVCDGVSSAMRSEDASQAAADAAALVLSRATSTGVGVPSSIAPAMSARLDTATDAAADAVAQVTEAVHRELGGEVERTMPGRTHVTNPSCTFVAAAIDGPHVVVGSVGDSRAYWFPDDAPPVRLTTDDSWAEEQIALGATREQAESGPGAHTITRWLGVDAPDHTPRKSAFDVDRPGWLILCSDGLWNYASEPAALAEVLTQSLRFDNTDARSDADTSTDANTPLSLARSLVRWANSQGGHDNITVIAARLHPEPGDAPADDEREAAVHG